MRRERERIVKQFWAAQEGDVLDTANLIQTKADLSLNIAGDGQRDRLEWRRLEAE